MFDLDISGVTLHSVISKIILPEIFRPTHIKCAIPIVSWLKNNSYGVLEIYSNGTITSHQNNSEVTFHLTGVYIV